jgi:hypothetical protein
VFIECRNSSTADCYYMINSIERTKRIRRIFIQKIHGESGSSLLFASDWHPLWRCYYFDKLKNHLVTLMRSYFRHHWDRNGLGSYFCLAGRPART